MGVAPAPEAGLVARPLPDEFVRWQLDARLATLDRIARGEHIPMFGARPTSSRSSRCTTRRHATAAPARS